jgi:DNA-binding FadR family transcriptional regulator
MPQSIRPTSAARAAVFAPLDGTGRAELVERRLTDAIVLGIIGSGERLPSETEMARRFGVATVTAREALEALREKGLVDTRRGRGGGSFVSLTAHLPDLVDDRVRSLSRVELRDMGVYYAAIAASAVEIAADRTTPDDIEHLHFVTGLADRESEGSARRAEGTFRLEIAALAQSARLVREELRMQAEFTPLLWLCLRERAFRVASAESHERVIRAIAALDPDTARRETRDHIGLAIDWLLDAHQLLVAHELVDAHQPLDASPAATPRPQNG